jgi:D-glycero-alpha-D-manno-heptose-7-phosphate kinase
MHRAWENKKRMAASITNHRIDEIYEVARKKGALGGKITGAGGGGHMLLFCPFERRHVVREAIEKLGAAFVPFHIEPEGAQAWEVAF